MPDGVLNNSSPWLYEINKRSNDFRLLSQLNPGESLTKHHAVLIVVKFGSTLSRLRFEFRHLTRSAVFYLNLMHHNKNECNYDEKLYSLMNLIIKKKSRSFSMFTIMRCKFAFVPAFALLLKCLKIASSFVAITCNYLSLWCLMEGCSLRKWNTSTFFRLFISIPGMLVRPEKRLRRVKLI